MYTTQSLIHHGAPAVVAERLGMAGGTSAHALAGITFRVGQSEFFGLVGPIGAGKTTLLRTLATLLKPDAGRLTVLGYDAHAGARQIRRLIGYAGQSAGLDVLLTGRETIKLHARLHGMHRRDANARADEMLARMDLTTLADCRVGHYPPGAQKRLAVAAALAHRPGLLLLDDPTDTLAAHDRAPFWHQLRSAIQDQATAVLLATKQSDEAESLCGRVAIMDAGRIIASGTPAELKAQVAGVTIAVRLTAHNQAPLGALLLERLSGVQATWSHMDRIELAATGASVVPAILRLLEEHDIGVRDVLLSKPSLDEVFFRHTGRNIRDAREQPVTGSIVPGRR